MNGPHVTAIVLAAGRSERAGGLAPKQFLDLAGRPLVAHSLEVFESSLEISSIVLVLPSEHRAYLEEPLDSPKLESIAIGGELRQDSLAQGMVCLPEATDVVLVHDAARPLVTQDLVERVLSGLKPPFDGSICVVDEEDALKEVSPEAEVMGFRSKHGFKRAQTPQAFSRGPMEDAIARVAASGETCEDCSEMLTRAGYRVRTVPGDHWNIKVTRTSDLGLCERILEARGSMP